MNEASVGTPIQLDERVFRTEFPDGLVVLSEEVPGVRSASVGIWVRWGASHEPAEQMGVCHFIEHMVFKGTEKQSAREIGREIEGIGGSLDAYTTREHTAYFARVLDEDLPTAVDVLSDLVRRPLFRDDDLEVEKKVILEEIAGVDDTPEDLVFDLHARALWGDHPYGNPVLGSAATVSAATSDGLRRLWADHYRRGNFVVAAAGNLRHEELLELVRSALSGEVGSSERAEVPEPVPAVPAQLIHVRDTSQAHICFGSAIFPHNDPRRYAAILVSIALGGGMSSHLFQRVREELGLAYAVYTYQSFYSQAGVAGVYLGTRPDMAARATDEVRAELLRLAATGLGADELESVKNQAKGQVMLSLESTSSRLHRLAGVALYDEPYRTLDELCELIDAVSEEEVADLCRAYYAPERQTVVRLGPESEQTPVEAA